MVTFGEIALYIDENTRGFFCFFGDGVLIFDVDWCVSFKIVGDLILFCDLLLGLIPVWMPLENPFSCQKGYVLYLHNLNVVVVEVMFPVLRFVLNM